MDNIIYVDFLSGERISKEEYYVMDDIMHDCWHRHKVVQNLRSRQYENNPDLFDLEYKQ